MRSKILCAPCLLLALAACGDATPDVATATAGPAAAAASGGSWVAAVPTGTPPPASQLQFELASAPRAGDVVELRLRWQSAGGQPAARWRVSTEGALQAGSGSGELSVPALESGKPHEATLELRAGSTGFGELLLLPADGAPGWAIPVWVSP